MSTDGRPPRAGAESEETPRRIVIVNAGTSSPSSSRMLADRIAQKTLDRLREQDLPATVAVIELGPLVGPIGTALVSGSPAQGELLDAVRLLAAADGVIATTPIYKAGMSGLFKSFVDVLDNDLLIAKPVVLAATAGSARHALVADDQLRPLFAFMRALTTPTSVFAAPEDWADTALSGRIVRAATELAALVASGVGSTISGTSWGRYQHTFGSNARPDDEPEAAIDFDTDLMRLATGGTSAPRQS
jgi:FMN reductase